MSAGGEHLKDEGSKSQVVMAGAIAGLVSRFCIAPLDVIKIRLQLQSHPPSSSLSQSTGAGSVYNGATQMFRTIMKEEGLTGLWKGNVSAEMLYVCYGGSQFVSYRAITQAQARLPNRLPSAAESFISGAGAGAISTTVTYPLDLLRTRFAAQGTEKVYASLFSAVRDIAKYEGLAGFFQGLPAAVGQIVPYMGLFFAGYEFFRIPMKNTSLPFGSGDAVAGIMASTIAKTGVFPLDLVRKRLQVQGPTRSKYVYRDIPEYRGVISSMRTIFVNEGIRGLYRGLAISLIKAAPTSAITMWTYERALKVLKAIESPTEKEGYF